MALEIFVKELNGVTTVYLLSRDATIQQVTNQLVAFPVGGSSKLPPAALPSTFLVSLLFCSVLFCSVLFLGCE